MRLLCRQDRLMVSLELEILANSHLDPCILILGLREFNRELAGKAGEIITCR